MRSTFSTKIFSVPRLGRWVVVGLSAWVLLWTTAARADSTSPAPSTAASRSAHNGSPSGKVGAMLPVASNSAWADLTAAQQASLKPLGETWNTLSEPQKRKWLSLSKNYAKMPPSEQSKLQSRMTEWVALSAQQRTQARLNYAQAKAIPPDQRQSKWREYQALSPEEKRKLASNAVPAPKGAAPELKPAASSPLSANSKRPRGALGAGKVASVEIDKVTLLPKTPKPRGSASSSGGATAAPSLSTPSSSAE